MTHPLFSFGVVVPTLVCFSKTCDGVGFSPFHGCFLLIKFGTFGRRRGREKRQNALVGGIPN